MENQNEETKSTGRGGARSGAGRPKGRKDCGSLTLRLPKDVAEILDEQENRTAFVLEAIREYDRKLRTRNIISLNVSYTKERRPKAAPEGDGDE